VAEGRPATATDGDGAAFHGHWPLCEFLLESGAEVNRADEATGETALHRPAAFGGEETIDQLLAGGARRAARDANGDTPLGWASWYGRPDAILRKLLHGEHRIHPDRRPMAASLLGRPRGGGG
jgi:ankyrin repeat protein